MKKKILAALLGVCLCWCSSPAYDANCQTAEARAIRYFMQGENVSGSDTPYGNNPLVGRYAQTDDAKIYYEVYGEGTPIFIFHGGGVGTPYEMGRMIDNLRQDHQVVVVSTRGHGLSEIGYTPLTYEQKANDMIVVMRQITTKPAAIVGFSDGAYTAYKVAAMYPEAVERIVAIGAGTLKPGYYAEGTLNVADMEKIDKAFIDQQKSIMPEPERLQEFWTEYMKFWTNMDVGEDLLGKIKCHVLLIAGDEDDHAPIATMMEAHQMIPNSQLCIVPKAWHTAFLDNFAVTWAAMDAFIHADANELAPSKKVEYNSRYKYVVE